MEPEVIIPLLLAASAFIFFSSIIHSFRSDLPSGSRVNLILATVCSSPWIFLIMFAAISPKAAASAYIFFIVGPFIALLSIGFFLAGRIGIGGWRNDVLAVGLSIVFGGLVYLFAATTS